jgi:hypothetical protein
MLYVVLMQPDLDWDFIAELIGVFTTRQAAEDASKAYTHTRIEIVEANPDVDMFALKYPRPIK